MNFNVNHVIIDIETLSKYENAIITSLSILAINFEKDVDATYEELLERSCYIKFDVEDQIKRFNRKSDASTVNWWKSQPEQARINSVIKSSDDIKTDDGICIIRDYLIANDYDWKKSYVWTRGIAYDIPKIESLIEYVVTSKEQNSFTKDFTDETSDKEKQLLNYWHARDTRTYIDIIGNTDNGYLSITEPEGFIKHHAKHDNAFEAYKMLLLYK